MHRNRQGTLAVICAILFALGLITAALGPLLPELAANTGSPLAALGTVFTALFLGSLVALLTAGPLADHVGTRLTLLTGLVVLTLGVLGIATSRALPLTLVCTFVAGLGHGAINISSNVMISEVFADRRVTAVNLINVFFGAGAVIGPLLVGVSWRSFGAGLPALYAASAILLAMLPLVARMSAPAAPVSLDPAARRAGIYRSPLLWAFGALVMLYVGAENGVGGWTTAYMQRVAGLQIDAAALVTSGFWLALTGGRLLGAALGARVSSDHVLLLCLGTALAGGAALVAGQGSVPAASAAVILLGLGFGPVYPTCVAVITAAFPQGPARATSAAVAMGSLGGMAVPWLQIALLETVSPAASALFAAGVCLAMGCVYLGVRGLRAG
jgi:fucose permease